MGDCEQEEEHEHVQGSLLLQTREQGRGPKVANDNDSGKGHAEKSSEKRGEADDFMQIPHLEIISMCVLVGTQHQYGGVSNLILPH